MASRLMGASSGSSGRLKLLIQRCGPRKPLNMATFVTASQSRQWKNETPPGSLTELYVFRPESGRIWPDPTLGAFSPRDPGFSLPGNVGWVDEGADKANQVDQNRVHDLDSSSLLTAQTAQEHQTQVLHSACDYIQHTRNVESEICCDILETFPELEGARLLHCRMQEAPTLLRKELQGLFPERDIRTGLFSVLTVARKTENDMTGWSQQVEEERTMLAEQFVCAAKEICARLRGEGYWADFIDPCSGTPYYHCHTNTTMFETDEKYRLLGFRIEDLGCCKVITHRDFGRNVFVGTIFTDATVATGVVQDMVHDMKMVLEGLSKS